MRRRLGHAVQVDARVDGQRAAIDPVEGAPVEGGERRRLRAASAWRGAAGRGAGAGLSGFLAAGGLFAGLGLGRGLPP